MIEAIIYLVFLFVGFYMGRMTGKTSNDTNVIPEVKMPNLNPLQAYREYKEKKEEEKEIEKLEIILENIENYDGTERNQKDVPA